MVLLKVVNGTKKVGQLSSPLPHSSVEFLVTTLVTVIISMGGFSSLCC